MKYDNLISVYEGEDLVNLAPFLNLKHEKMLNGKEYYMLVIRSKFRQDVRRINTRILSDKIYSFLKNETNVIMHSGKRYSVARTDFKAGGYNVYLVYQEGDSVPCTLYRALEHYNIITLLQNKSQHVPTMCRSTRISKPSEIFQKIFPKTLDILLNGCYNIITGREQKNSFLPE